QPVDGLLVLLGRNGYVTQPLLNQRQLQTARLGAVQRSAQGRSRLAQIPALLRLLRCRQGLEYRRVDCLLSHHQAGREQQRQTQCSTTVEVCDAHGHLSSRRKYKVLVASRATGWPFSRRGAKRQRLAARRASR